MYKDRTWLERAACAPRNIKPENEDIDWYTGDLTEKYRARNVCQSECPVRKECMKDALDNFDIWGIHGGTDDYEIRRALAVDADGEPAARSREPRCPYCLSRKIEVSGTRVKGRYPTKCSNPECGLEWAIAIIPRSMRKKRQK